AQDLFWIGQEGEDGGGWSGNLRLSPDHERFGHRRLLDCGQIRAATEQSPDEIANDRGAASSKDRPMQLSATLSWLVDAACETQGADRFLAELGTRLIGDGVRLAGGALALAVPHPLIARRTWLWRAENGEVMEALGFVPGGRGGVGPASPPGDAGRRWLTGLAAGAVHEDVVGGRPGGPSLSWIGPRPFTPDDADRLRQAARFAAAPLAALTARATL